ncbi:MAG: hypothetical protein ABJG78_06290 [Cyclobacteriaceae bacterium]
MKKSTAQIIVIAVIALIILNVTLIGLMWGNKKEHNPKERRPIEEINDFIIKEIGFNKQQAEAFVLLSQKHHQAQRANQNEFKRIKDQLNSLMLKGEQSEVDSLISQFAEVATTRETELFRFFREVLLICDDEQKQRLQHVFFQATGPPEYAKMPFDEKPKGQRLPR